MNMLPLVVAWAALATVVLALAAYRKMIARKEDDYLHVDSNVAVQQQEAVAKKLEVIDKWGKILTVLAVVFALVLLGIFLYNGWNDSATKIAS